MARNTYEKARVFASVRNGKVAGAIPAKSILRSYLMRYLGIENAAEHTFVERILFRDDTEKIRVDKAFILVRGKG